MTMNKDSPEAITFMRLFGKLKDWSEDDPESLPDLASTDASIQDLCLELLKAAGSLQNNERGDRDLFTGPVDLKFISDWCDFEERFANALLIVLSNAFDDGKRDLALSFDWYEQLSSWEVVDRKATDAAELIEVIFKFAQAQADKSEKNSIAFTGKERIKINWEVSESLRMKWTALRAMHDKLVKQIQLCDDEAQKSELNNKLAEYAQMGFDDDGVPLEDIVKLARADWEGLKDNAGFDLRGVLRRRALVPFVLFPRHVAAQHGQADMLSIYENLRQAHNAFVFGAPFAALALMRSIMEIVLRDHYGAQGDDLPLSERINNSNKCLPGRANAAALHHLRRRANAVLHATEKDEAIQKLETAQLEREIVWLLRVLRVLIEGAPSKASIAATPAGNQKWPR